MIDLPAAFMERRHGRASTSIGETYALDEIKLSMERKACVGRSFADDNFDA